MSKPSNVYFWLLPFLVLVLPFPILNAMLMRNYSQALQICTLLELLTERIVGVTLLALGNVERVTVVWREIDALLQPEDKIRCGDEVATKDYNNIAVLVFLVQQPARRICLEATSNEDRARGVQWEERL